MQTPDVHETPRPAPADGPHGADGIPPVDVLLRRSAQGDRASFSAFYDATVPWVHGMASAMFRSPRDAAEATAQTYLTAWEEAQEAELDLSEQDDAVHRERLVFTWLEVLAHRVMTGLLRSDSVPDHGHRLLPERAGVGDAGGEGIPEDLVPHVAPAAFEAVRWAWLGGQTDTQIAARLGVGAAEARTLVRDGVQEIAETHRRLARGAEAASTDAAQPPSRPVGVPLAASTREDIEAGRAGELADLAAVHALDTASHTAVSAAVQRQGAGETARWRSRVDRARRAVTWAFRDTVAEPPSALLDEVLRRLPAQDVGMTLVDENRAPRPPRDRARPFKVALLALLAVLVLVVGVWAAWSQFSRPGIVHRVDGAGDLYTTSEYPAKGGGTVQGFLSAEEDSGFVTVSGLPQLPAGQAYQVWLHPADGSAPSSLGQFQANDFGEPLTFRGLQRFAALSISVEPDGGSDVPTSDFLVGVALNPGSDTGPQYGGRPSQQG